MNKMFKDCSSLKELNISNFNSNNVNAKNNMFLGCSNELRNKVEFQLNNIQ